MNSGAAMQALHETDKNSNKLSKDLQKVASGMKINGAGDGAAEYAISEKMRVMVRSLGQDIENAKKGIDLVKVAEEGMLSIVDELRDMKAMAINSANDHNSEVDRAVLQKEFASRMESIDDIAATTNYNGKVLMDGRYWYTEYEEEAIINSTGNSSAINVTTARRLSANNFNSVWGPPQMMRTRLFSANAISSSATLEPTAQPVDNNIENVFPVTPTMTSKGGINGYAPPYGTVGTNSPSTYTRLLVQSNGRFNPPIYSRTASGTIEYTIRNMPQEGQTVYFQNGYNSYTACTFYKDGNDYRITSQDYSNISDRNMKGYQATLDFSNASINGRSLNFPSDLNNQSITILCPGCYQYAGIKLETGRAAGTGVLYTPAPSYQGPYKDARVYVIGIGSDNCTQEDILASIFTGIKAANAANGIRNVDENTLTLDPYHGVSFYRNTQTNTYSFYKTDMPMIIYNGGVGTLTGGGEEEAQIEPSPPNPPEPDPPEPDPPEPDPPEPDPPEPNPQYERRSKRFEGNPLIIHYGPKQNQHLRVYINDMHTKAMGLQNVVIDPIEEARKALGKLDEALDYALNELTRMGAYQTKLQYTIDNNTTAEENTTSAESVIRDADMAKSMMNYVKDNILTQTSKAMLAQANQNSGIVLRLLQ
jgi:flagellin-like hook-associated protein FlgL